MTNVARVKVVRPGFRRRTDAEWAAGRTFNALVEAADHESAVH